MLLLATNLMCGKEDKTKCKCQVCSKEPAYYSGTTNLHEHLINKHSDSYKVQDTKYGSEEKQETLLPAFRSLHCSDARAKEITYHITDFVALDMQLVHVVKGEGV